MRLNTRLNLTCSIKPVCLGLAFLSVAHLTGCANVSAPRSTFATAPYSMGLSELKERCEAERSAKRFLGSGEVGQEVVTTPARSAVCEALARRETVLARLEAIRKSDNELMQAAMRKGQSGGRFNETRDRVTYSSARSSNFEEIRLNFPRGVVQLSAEQRKLLGSQLKQFNELKRFDFVFVTADGQRSQKEQLALMSARIQSVLGQARVSQVGITEVRFSVEPSQMTAATRENHTNLAKAIRTLKPAF
jgi:hypothetical protein